LTRIAVIFVMLIAGLILTGTSGQAQIYEPEGLNMPGAWNSWTNPPTNNLALASSNQVAGGRVVRIAAGTPRWQTSFSVVAPSADPPGDIISGTYEWLFTSGSSSNYYQNKWSAVTIVMNTLQEYTKEGATNNSITLLAGKWYTMNFEDLGYVNTRAIFMETSAQPVDITAVSVPSIMPENTPVPIAVTTSLAPAAEEIIYVRYSADAWATSTALPVTMTGTSGAVSIPGQVAGTVVSYYAFSSTVAAAAADFDLVSIKLNNNTGTNYTYTVSAAPVAITFANLQWPQTGSGVTGLPTPAPGLQSWVGYNTANTDPSTWLNWIVATYNAPVGNNDEFKANLGAAITGSGTFYYATRFQLNADPYKYGGFSATGGGFWDGVNNVSGVLDVLTGIPDAHASGLSVYPNPTFGSLSLELSTPATIRFTNAIGNMLMEKDFAAGHQVIDISAFRTGAYHLQVITGDHTTHQTIIKR
ncbi:MAG: T9SS type A sorting domain-containing protein, partial [Bacteroidetes bacterium]|nr:T9SS type A sorting domain-containing protein [Bacteroidota bacterium]